LGGVGASAITDDDDDDDDESDVSAKIGGETGRGYCCESIIDII
jgi:hypothetical protein